MQAQNGLDIYVTFFPHSPFGNIGVVLHNATEIHYGFADLNRIAFESDIHDTGSTYDVIWIKEFEAKISSKTSEEF